MLPSRPASTVGSTEMHMGSCDGSAPPFQYPQQSAAPFPFSVGTQGMACGMANLFGPMPLRLSMMADPMQQHQVHPCVFQQQQSGLPAQTLPSSGVGRGSGSRRGRGGQQQQLLLLQQQQQLLLQQQQGGEGYAQNGINALVSVCNDLPEIRTQPTTAADFVYGGNCPG
ncbi:hypothetical protein T492DRAFT_63759 [Pavlovales sp. CCMP2436]|nr:hypothetical protein T492DRAFT_63759 [Pavlovales sp. CCMP2436]